MGRGLDCINRQHIIPFWNDRDIYGIKFTTPTESTIGFDLENKNDLELYNSRITANIFRGLPDFLNEIQFYAEFKNMQNKVYAVHEMLPGTLLPLHRDKYSFYKKKNNIEDSNKIIRIILFLQDKEPGHILEIDNYSVSNWLAGDWISWIGTDLHLAANLGNSNRYTLQITGTDI
jgi:hypothetical protein